MRWSLQRSGIGWALGILILTACAAPSTDDSAVVARYDGGEVTRAELIDWIDRLAAADELPEPGRDWRRRALERLVARRLLGREAVEAPTAVVGAAAEAALAQAMREQLGWTRLRIEPEAARAFYEADPTRFARPERLRLQHIFLRSDLEEATAEEREAVRARAWDLHRRAVAGADFGALARAHSDSADAGAGGWMVLERGARVVRAFAEAAWALEPGEVSEPIDTATGFHLVRLSARLAPVERPFSEIAEQVAAAAADAERRRLEAEYLETHGPRHGLARSYRVLEGPVRLEAVVLSLADERWTIGDLLRSVPETLLPHVYAGYLPQLSALLDQRALEWILVREARAEGVDRQPDVQRSMDLAVLEARAEVEIERRLRERAAAVSAADLRDLHARHRERFAKPRLRTLSVIRLAPRQGELLWSLLRQGERVVEAVRAGADFEAAGREAGGVVYAGRDRWAGWSDAELVTRVLGRDRDLARLEALEVGEVSEPFVAEVFDAVRGRFEPTCVYVFRLDELEPPRPTSFAEAEPAVRAAYLRQHRARLVAEIERQALSDSGLRVVVDDLPGRRR